MPSDEAIARAIERRALMPRIRQAAAALQVARRIEVTQRGQAVAVAQARGPVRLRLAVREDRPC